MTRSAEMTNRDELRQAVTTAIAEQMLGDDFLKTLLGNAGDAAIEAYEAHRPRAAVVLTREEWDQAAIGIYSAAYRIKWGDPTSFDAFEAISAAFPWIRVEDE